MTEEMTVEQVDEFLKKYGDMDEDQLINELGVHLLESNPEGMKAMMAKEGRDVDVEGLLEYMKAQREVPDAESSE